jgi:hypothetical protein
MHCERRTNKTYVGFHIGTHEDTLLCITLAPRLNKQHVGFIVGLSLLYLNLFTFEWVYFF